MLDRVATSSRVRLPENTAMRRRRRTLYIFVEVGARELLSRLVVAEEARRRGYRVVLGEKNLLRNLCWMFPLPAGIILDKCGQMCRSYPVLALKRRGFRYVVLDEEGIFFAHANRAPEPSDLLLFNSEYQRRRSNRQAIEHRRGRQSAPVSARLTAIPRWEVPGIREIMESSF